MVPVEGGCDEKSTNVHVCKNCLLAAADEKSEEEVVWNQATEKPDKLPTTATSTNAYVITDDFGHDYVPVYFRLSDGKEIPFTQTTCAVGFNVKYVCDECGEVVINVPVADDPATIDEKQDKETNETNEAYNNKVAKVEYTDAYGNKKSTSVFTDADGFVLDVNGADLEVGITSEDFQADELAAVLASKEDNKGDHKVTVASEYAKRNGYVASTCISTAEIPVVCENCGAALSYTYDQLKTESTTDGFAYDWAEDTENSIGSLEDAVNAVVKNESDRKLNYLNHVEGAKIFDCGTHCDAYDAVNKLYICSGFDTEGTDHDSTVKLSAVDFNAVDHSTVTVDYELANDSNYYETYSLKVATFYNVEENAAIDWSQAVMTDSTKLSKCANDGDMPAYVMPSVPGTDESGAYTHNAKADSVYYLVLVSEDGKNIYPVADEYATAAEGVSTAPALFTETNNKNIVTSETKVEKDDTFFLSLNGAQNLKAPVYATNLSSLAKAISVAEVDNKGVLTITLAEGVTFETIGRLSEIDSTILTAIQTALSGKNGMTSIVLDLNGSTIPVAADPTMAAANSEVAVTVKNGAINYKKATNENTDNYFITLAVGTSVTFDNVDINAGALNGISVDPAAKLVMKDSSVTSYGTMGISVDKSGVTTPGQAPTTNAITLTDTDIVMAKDPTALPTTAPAMSTAMLVGEPVNVSVKGGEFSANGQVLVVRGGDVSVSTTKLTLNAYTDTRVVVADTDGETKENEVEFSSLFTNKTAVAAPWNAFIAGVTDVQTYRMAGLWGTGADVARAAVVLGNNDTSNNQFAASLRLDRANIVVGDGEETVVVGTTYDKSVFDGNKATTGTTTTYTPVVTLNATGSALSADRVVYTYNAYNTTTGALNNAEYISMVGLIPVAD